MESPPPHPTPSSTPLETNKVGSGLVESKILILDEIYVRLEKGEIDITGSCYFRALQKAMLDYMSYCATHGVSPL
ncbi:hypothetical protein MRB53_013765 [Persea americana]|uniref:Uncharacterized protein n=1 Tax=Persea americana TaxID=3435 RepID=A0ACC2K9F4_PERAE|nr:hypothetical protein MRB53_013765 [Persea americana]